MLGKLSRLYRVMLSEVQVMKNRRIKLSMNLLSISRKRLAHDLAWHSNSKTRKQKPNTAAERERIKKEIRTFIGHGKAHLH